MVKDNNAGKCVNIPAKKCCAVSDNSPDSSFVMMLLPSCVFVCLFTCLFVFVCLCVCVCVCVFVCVEVCVFICVCVCVHMCVFRCLLVYVCALGFVGM